MTGTRRKPESNIAAVTMVYSSPALLRKWVEHYGSIFGDRSLYVISHGFSEDHIEISKNCNHITIPRNFSSSIDQQKSGILSSFCALLLNVYDGVVCGDVDELIAPHPDTGKNLEEYIQALPDKGVFAPVGFNVMPKMSYYDGPVLDLDRPILAQCNRVSLASNFSKPSILKRAARFAPGNHWLIGEDFTFDHNLYLFHLKYLALNGEHFYEDVARDVVDYAQESGRPIRQKFWSRGMDGLRSIASRLDEADEEPVRNPREEARQLELSPVSEGNSSLRVVGPKLGAPFLLDDSWRDVL